MGHGIAQEFAVSGHAVSLNDLSEERLAHARARIRDNLEMLGRTSDWAEVAARLTFTDNLPAAVREADIVVEATSEDLNAKRSLFKELDIMCPANVILASNTSTFMPSQLFEAVDHPGRAIVTHYFNPPYLVPLVEVVAGPATSPETVEAIRHLLVSIGKTPIVLEKESLGFIANRLQAALFRECFALIESGIARPEDIDAVVTSSFGRRLAVAGPFEAFDVAGADIWHAISERLMPDIESSGEVPPTMARLVEEGNLGLKTGSGVYEWTEESASELRRRTARALQEIQRWNRDD